MNEKKYILEQTSEEERLKKKLMDRMPTVIKVLDSLVFNKLDINYELKLQQMMRTHGANARFYLELDLDVEVDRLNRSLPVFDQKYEDTMFNMEDRISAALGYVGLQSYYNDARLNYINDSETERQMKELMETLYVEIQKEYPNVPLDRIKESELFYYLNKIADGDPHIRVDVGGEEVIEDAKWGYNILINCKELWRIMSRVYENHPIGQAFGLDNFLC